MSTVAQWHEWPSIVAQPVQFLFTARFSLDTCHSAGILLMDSRCRILTSVNASTSWHMPSPVCAAVTCALASQWLTPAGYSHRHSFCPCMSTTCSALLLLLLTPCCVLQYFAHLRIIPVVAAISEPTPGCTLIELDAVAVSFPQRPWFAPITWLLPDHVAKNVHLKIGVNGSLENGKVHTANAAGRRGGGGELLLPSSV